MAHDHDYQAALDGALTPAEAERLARSLQSDAEARRQFDALKRVDAALRSLESVNPPPDLRDGVMRQIRFGRAWANASTVQTPGRWRGLWERLWGVRPAFQVGLGFALGMLVLLPLVWSSSRLGVDPGQVAGTLTASGLAPSKLEIEGPGLSGTLLKGVEGEPLTLDLQLRSQSPVEAVLEFQSPVQALSAIEMDGAGTSVLEYSSRHLTLRHTGDGRYVLKFITATNTWPPMNLRVSAEGVPVFEEAVP